MKPIIKKTLKISGITLGSIVGLLLILVLLVCILVFSSSSLTNIAEKAIDKYSPARAKIDDVDLTLVGTYPFLGFRLNGLVVYDDMEDSPSDTLAAIDEFTVTVDFKSLYKEKKIILTNLFIDGVSANLFTAADGRSNLDVFGLEPAEEEPEPEESGDLDIYADLQKISVERVNASYIDLSSGTKAAIDRFGIELKGLLNYDSLEAKTGVKIAKITAAIQNDSTDISASLDDLRINGNLTKFGEDVNADLTLNLKQTNAAMGDIKARIDGIKFVLDKVCCTLGSEGLGDVVAGLRADVSDIKASLPGISASTGAIVMKTPKAVFTGDSAHVEDFTFDTRAIAVEMVDSAGNITKADIEKVLVGLNSGLKLDMSNVAAAVALAVEGLTFDMGGETPIGVQSDEIRLDLNAGLKTDDLAADTKLTIPSIDVVMGGETYVPGWSLGLTLPLEAKTDMSRFAILNGANVDVNGQRIGFSGNGTMGSTGNIAGRVRINTMEDLDLDRLVAMIPESFQSLLEGIDVHGTVGLDINVKGGMNEQGPVLDKATADIRLQQLEASMNDSLKAASGKLTAHVNYPSLVAVDKDRMTADVALAATDLQVTMVDSTTINASIDGFDLNASAAVLLDQLDKSNVQVDIKARRIEGDMDTIFGTLNNTAVKLNMAPQGDVIAMRADIGLESLTAGMGCALAASLGATRLQAFAQYDSTKQDVLSQFNPEVKMTLKDGKVDMLAEPVVLKTLDFDFSLGRFNINECRAEIDDSDLQIWGDVYNIGEFLNETGLLTGELYVESDHVNVNKLMTLAGTTEADTLALEQTAQEIEAGQDTITASPIMIPKGIDLTLYTNLSNVDFNDHTFNNVGGDVSIKDGVIILQELGFSSKAAEMQLTAIYRTPNVEDRFMELDFHLLDIEIDELIDLVPAVDSIVPMLKALSGKAQFHLSAQTYLEPDYVTHGPLYPQMSSLIGNAVIEGANLVVLDNEVFNSIKRKLLMSKDASPVIDSLDVELQVSDEKVDLYPTRIKMDRYEAIISGRHNIDAGLSCNYNVSVTQTPLPIRLGVTISGSLEDIANFPIRHIKVGKAKYGKLYRPEKSGAVEEAILRRKNTILGAARSNVRPRASRPAAAAQQTAE